MAKDGSALAKNPFQDPRVREAVDLAIDRKALAEIAMEGLGKAQSQLVTPSHLRLQQGSAAAQIRPGGGEEAAGRCRLSQRLQGEF
jgi:ABC-type transport system substrate-binding protein